MSANRIRSHFGSKFAQIVGSIVMPPKGARKRPAAALDTSAADDALHRTLVQCGTQVGLVNTLIALQDAGWLTDDAVRSNTQVGTRRRLHNATTCHSTSITPYGRVVQYMQLPLEKLPNWEYINPLALLYYLSSICVPFGNMMRESNTPGVPMKIIIYIDEICPGNPLRPEKSRTLQALYWACAEWPQHVLQRTAAWPTFGTIRSTLVSDHLPGGVPALLRRVLTTFWPQDGNSFSRGISITVANMPLVITAVFGGFLADDKALTEIGDGKGASGFQYEQCTAYAARVHSRHRIYPWRR